MAEKKKTSDFPSAEFRFFIYDHCNGDFTYYRTPEERDADADAVIHQYLDEGWDEDVEFVVAGEVTAVATKVNVIERPPEDQIDDEGMDEDGRFWGEEHDYCCNYEMLPLPAAPGDTAAPELARHQLSAEDLAQVRAAAKESLLATILPGGAMALLNDGSEPDYSHLNCPACGGSGHIDDVQDAAPEQAEQQCPQCAGTGYDCPDCIQAAEQDAVAVPAGITIDRDLMGTMHIKCGDFDFIQIQYQYPYTDNASTRRLAEQIAALLGGDA